MADQEQDQINRLYVQAAPWFILFALTVIASIGIIAWGLLA